MADGMWKDLVILLFITLSCFIALPCETKKILVLEDLLVVDLGILGVALVDICLLSSETLPNVKDGFAIISKEESHRGLASSSFGKIGHTVDRCSDIVCYPPGYIKNLGPKPNGPRIFIANSVSSSNEKGASLSFNNEQMMKLMNLINETSRSVQANMADLVILLTKLLICFNRILNSIRTLICLLVTSVTRLSKQESPFPFNDRQTTSIGELIHLDFFADDSEVDLATSMGENSSSEGNVPSTSIPLSQRNLLENSNQGQPDLRRCMLNIAICNNWDIFQLDVNNAFLYGDLTEDVYMTLPPGFHNDKSKNSYNVFIVLLVYLDDIVMTRNDLNEIEKFKQFLKTKFQIKDLGKLKFFLGIKVLDNKEGIFLSQRKYYLELLHEFGVLAGKHVETPLPKNTTLNHIETNDVHLLVNVGNYQRLVGKLIYLTNTRPDIAYAINCLSQFMHSPLNSHLDVALRVLRYLKGSPGSGIQINRNGNLKLRAYAHSDWARCLATRKSVSGYYVFLGDSLVTWKSKKQSTLSRSSAEAEYGSMAFATCEVLWLSNLLGDMGVKNLLPVVMYCDNSSALQIAANHVFHEKSKHFEIDFHLVREKLASGVIKTEKIHTTQQIADILTKGHDIEQHKVLCDKLRMLDMFKLEKT
uniref:Ribonuclease H-like domain-containing protein n=1 Tax=Tanacetum cinerariifolium TaxID=118510 RepID=A0A6L2KB82_TANCI|nr:ribonuclease H-like domain-containing protein [Tanacetum cinerariifolium]